MADNYHSVEFEKWFESAKLRINGDEDEINCRKAWNAALATQQQPQGDTCKAEPKHPMWALQWMECEDINCSAPRHQVCILCHHAQALAAKESELAQILDHHHSDQRVITDLQNMVEEKQERIQELEQLIDTDFTVSELKQKLATKSAAPPAGKLWRVCKKCGRYENELEHAPCGFRGISCVFEPSSTASKEQGEDSGGD